MISFDVTFPRAISANGCSVALPRGKAADDDNYIDCWLGLVFWLFFFHDTFLGPQCWCTLKQESHQWDPRTCWFQSTSLINGWMLKGKLTLIFLSHFPSPPYGQPPEWRCYINKHLQPGLPQSSLNQRLGQIRELISNVQPCIISRKLRRFPPKLLVSNRRILIAKGAEPYKPCFLQ